MGSEKTLHGRTGLIAGSVLNHDDMTSSLRQHVEQKSGIAFRMKAPLMGFVEKLPREIVNESKHLVAFAFAAGAHFGLFPFGRPGIAQRAPLGKAGFIAKEQERFALPSLA